MIFNSLLAYAAFPFVGKCSNLIELRSKPLPLEIARISFSSLLAWSRFWRCKVTAVFGSFQTISLFFHQKLWTRKLFLDKTEKRLENLSKRWWFIRRCTVIYNVSSDIAEQALGRWWAGTAQATDFEAVWTDYRLLGSCRYNLERKRTDCFERIGTDLNKSENRKAFLNTPDNQKNATDNTFMK